MPNEFDPEFQIDNGRIVPAGPLKLEEGEEVTRIFAWVVQLNTDGTGALCSGYQDDILPGSTRWSTRADAYHSGTFRRGLALATAVSISQPRAHWGLGGSKDEPRVFWWSESVILR